MSDWTAELAAETLDCNDTSHLFDLICKFKQIHNNALMQLTILRACDFDIWKKHESEAKPSETSHIYLVTTACLEQCDMADGKARRSFSIKDDRSRSLSLWILKGIHQLSKWERKS